MTTMSWAQQLLLINGQAVPGDIWDAESGELSVLSGRALPVEHTDRLQLPSENEKQPLIDVSSDIGTHSQTERPLPHVQGPVSFGFSSYDELSKPKQNNHNEPWPKVITLGKQQSLSCQNDTKQPKPESISSNFKETSPPNEQLKTQTPISSNVRTQKSSKNKRGPPDETPEPVRAKTSSDTSEPVRTKMRENLAAALALVTNEQKENKAEAKSSVGDAKNTTERDIDNKSKTTTIIDKETQSSLETGKEQTELQDPGEVLTSSSAIEKQTNNPQKMDHGEGKNLQFNSPFVENMVLEDELLLGNGLSWSYLNSQGCDTEQTHDSKRPKITHGPVSEPEPEAETPESLATKIEVELFKLFGGVNKKYKEKGRSLLFNLKDQHNPELRKRVLYGQIAPERLCSMTAEELASKELSQWRIAKAEELAQMIVLPDSDDNRRLVKKTHKGEFQVEVERDDPVSMEVALGGNAILQSRRGSKKDRVNPRLNSSKERGQVDIKSSETLSCDVPLLAEKIDLEDNCLDDLLQESGDFMQDFMVAEFKDADSLPPVPSLDEFMRDLDTLPPFENLAMDAEEECAISEEKDLDISDAKLDAAGVGSEPMVDSAPVVVDAKPNHAVHAVELTCDKVPISMSPKMESSASVPNVATDVKVNDELKSRQMDSKYAGPSKNSRHSVARVGSHYSSSSRRKSDVLWDGLVQLNVSSLVSVLGFYRSGERTAIQHWPGFLEIKGRVKLDAFEKFLQELSLCQSRGMMVLQCVWKDGSPESGRMKLCETIDSYIADERVGFAEPLPGVELYFCPPHAKTSQMLVRNLPLEHKETLLSITDGLIGVIIWKKPNVAAPLQQALPSSLKHTPREQPVLREHAKPNTTTTSSTLVAPPAEENVDDDDDDVPPGFGPPAAKSAEDDLPEFNFVQGRSELPPSNFTSLKTSAPVYAPPRAQPAQPVDRLRQLIQKYGQDETTNDMGIDVEPWNDDDDIPEWRPDEPNQFQPQPPSQFQGYNSDAVQQPPQFSPIRQLPGPTVNPGWRPGYSQGPNRGPPPYVARGPRPPAMGSQHRGRPGGGYNKKQLGWMPNNDRRRR